MGQVRWIVSLRGGRARRGDLRRSCNVPIFDRIATLAALARNDGSGDFTFYISLRSISRTLPR